MSKTSRNLESRPRTEPSGKPVSRVRPAVSDSAKGASGVDESLPEISDAAPYLSHEDVHQVIKTVDIPSCPGVLGQVMAEAQRDEPDLQKLSRIITSDVGLTALSLRFANSSLFRRGDRITSVRGAIAHLGTMNVVCILAAAALREALRGPSPAFLHEFWSRTSALATGAGLLARRHHGVPVDAAFMYAMFHDAGMPLMLCRYPDYADKLAACRRDGRMFIDTENAYYPCTHPIIGALLVRHWGIDESLIAAIRLHHDVVAYDLPETELPSRSLTLMALTQVAEALLSSVLGEPDLEVGDALLARAAAHLGIGQADMDVLREDIERALVANPI